MSQAQHHCHSAITKGKKRKRNIVNEEGKEEEQEDFAMDEGDHEFDAS